MMHWFARATGIEYHRLGGLNNRHLFLTVLDNEEYKTEVLADLVSGEELFPGLYMDVF